MGSDDQGNSDPLPYTQVDRAVKPKATLLAGMIGTTPQHALGSLVEFWDLFGDPREIEKLVAEGKHEVVVGREAVLEAFEAATGGKTLDPLKLVSLGLLEKRGKDLFRVRGMSRYFAPIEGRLETRRKASAGGKASVEARRKRYGTAQPSSGAGSTPGSAPASAAASAPVRSGLEPPFELPFEPVPNPPEVAVSGQRSAAATGEKQAPASRSRAISDTWCAVFFEMRGSKYEFTKNVDGPALARLVKKTADDTDLVAFERRVRLGIRLGAKWPGVSTLAQLDSRWNDLTVPATSGNGKGAAWTQQSADDGGFLAGLEAP